MKRVWIGLALLLLCVSGQGSASCSDRGLVYGDSCEERYRSSDDPHIYSFVGEEGDLVTITLTWDDDAEGELLIAGPVIEGEDNFELQESDNDDSGEVLLEEIELPNDGIYGVVVTFDGRADYTLTLEESGGDDDEVDLSFLNGTALLIGRSLIPDNPEDGFFGSILIVTDQGVEVVVDTDDDSYSNNCGDISDDGEFIVFTSNRDFNGASGNFTHSEIYSARADGSRQRRLTETEANEYGARWSSEGEHIDFIASETPNDADTYEIFLMDADGDNIEQITDNNDVENLPAWSPDGERIIFQSNSDGDYELYTMTPEGEDLQQLTDNDWDDYQAIYSPDGEQIVFTTNERSHTDLYLMDADGDNIERLTRGSSSEFAAIWSPDGDRLAFGYRDGSGAPSEIWVMDADGSDANVVFNDPNAYFGMCDWGVMAD